jgi:hypothetical protein
VRVGVTPRAKEALAQLIVSASTTNPEVVTNPEVGQRLRRVERCCKSILDTLSCSLKERAWNLLRAAGPRGGMPGMDGGSVPAGHMLDAGSCNEG